MHTKHYEEKKILSVINIVLNWGDPRARRKKSRKKNSIVANKAAKTVSNHLYCLFILATA
jgi:hypothetical protein